MGILRRLREWREDKNGTLIGPDIEADSVNTNDVNNTFHVLPGDSESEVRSALSGGNAHVHFTSELAGNPLGLTQRLELESNTKISAAGDGFHLKVADGADDYAISNKTRDETQAADENITIEGLHIDGNKDNQTDSATEDEVGNRGCFDFRNTTNLTVRNCLIFEPWSTGVNYTYSEDTTVLNNYIEKSGDDGVAANIRTKRSLIHGNYIVDSGVGKTSGGPKGIEVQDEAQYIAVSDNFVRDSAGDGIQISAHTGYDNDTDIAVLGNTIDNASDTGIEVDEGDGTFRRLLISQNQIRGCGLYGVDVDDSATDLKVSENMISDCASSGVRLTGNVIGGYTVTGNVLVENTSIDGHQIRLKAPNGTVSHNYAADSVNGIGIYASAKQISISSNVVENNASHGIRYDTAADPSGGQIANNVVDNNDQRGIYIVGVSTVSVIGNTATKNGGAGIETFSDTNYVSIIGNESYNNATDGIQSGGTNVLIAFNVARDTDGSQGQGIFISDGDAELYGNRVAGNTNDDYLGLQRATVENEIVVSENSDSPSPTGDGPVVINFTDTGDGSGDGIYYEDRDGVVHGPV